jgi:MoxR-vWA-beta-propeller ternary system domain bpX4
LKFDNHETETNVRMSASKKLWLDLLVNGRITFDGPPEEGWFTDRDAATVLALFWQEHLSAIGGPPLRFVENIGTKAARLVVMSAWYLVSRAGTPEDLARDLAFPEEPGTPDEHLSADLTLQFLPSIHQRASVLFPADRLPVLLVEILRRWPLSGVLADLMDAPIGSLDFRGHPGILLLYAERLAENFKPTWAPRGLGAPYLELVWAELGKDPALLAPMVSVSTAALQSDNSPKR